MVIRKEGRKKKITKEKGKGEREKKEGPWVESFKEIG